MFHALLYLHTDPCLADLHKAARCVCKEVCDDTCQTLMPPSLLFPSMLIAVSSTFAFLCRDHKASLQHTVLPVGTKLHLFLGQIISIHDQTCEVCKRLVGTWWTWQKGDKKKQEKNLHLVSSERCWPEESYLCVYTIALNMSCKSLVESSQESVHLLLSSIRSSNTCVSFYRIHYRLCWLCKNNNFV